MAYYSKLTWYIPLKQEIKKALAVNLFHFFRRQLSESGEMLAVFKAL